MRGLSSRTVEALMMEQSESSHLLLQNQTSQPNGECPSIGPLDRGGGGGGGGGDDQDLQLPQQAPAMRTAAQRTAQPAANGASRRDALGAGDAALATTGGESSHCYARASVDDDYCDGATRASCSETASPYGIARFANAIAASDSGFTAACGCCDGLNGGGARAHGSAAVVSTGSPSSLVLTRLLNIGAKLSNDRKQESTAAARELLGDCRNGVAAAARSSSSGGGGGGQRGRCAPLAALRARFVRGFLRRRKRRRRTASSSGSAGGGGGGDEKCLSMRPMQQAGRRVSGQQTAADDEAAGLSARAGSHSAATAFHGHAQAAAAGGGLVFDPAARTSHYWNGIVSLAFLYNFWVIVYRFAFDEVSADNYRLWLTLDYLADGVYVLDIGKHFRTAYLDEGVLQTQPAKMRARYMNSTSFYMDCLCLLPLDFLYLSIGFNSLLRLFRVLKVYRFWSFLDCIERHASYPNVVRALTMLHYLLAIFHWNACILHALVRSEPATAAAAAAAIGGAAVAVAAGGSGDAAELAAAGDASKWLPPVGAADAGNGTLASYVGALHWIVVVLTTTGSLPPPGSLRQYGYSIALMIFSLLLFAAVLGTVASIISSVGAARKDFQAKLDEVKTYMRQYGLPIELQERVIQWFEYLWANKGQMRDETALELLPERLKAEICIHVHLDTLKKVEIFQNTEAGFLKELVLRLRPALFSPGDYVCRKGEVGKEMYIVKKGVLDVLDAVGRPVARLVAGSYFGEISILNMGEVGNRRTASVRSVGYSDLFCLNKKDLWDVLKEYPAARFRLEEIAMQRLTSKDKVWPRRGGSGGGAAAAVPAEPRQLSASSELRTTAGDGGLQQKAPINRSHSTPGAVERSSLVPHEEMQLPEVRICIEGDRRGAPESATYADSRSCARSPSPAPPSSPQRWDVPRSGSLGDQAAVAAASVGGYLGSSSGSLLQPPALALGHAWSTALFSDADDGRTDGARPRGHGLPRPSSMHARMASAASARDDRGGAAASGPPRSPSAGYDSGFSPRDGGFMRLRPQQQPQPATVYRRQPVGGDVARVASGHSLLSADTRYLTLSAETGGVGGCSACSSAGAAVSPTFDLGPYADAFDLGAQQPLYAERAELSALRRRVFQLERENSSLRGKVPQTPPRGDDATGGTPADFSRLL